MGVSEKTDFLSQALRKQIDLFNLKRRENRRKALFFKLTVTALGGVTTVLLGLQGIGHENLLRNGALVLSAMVTLLSTWDTFFNHRGLWTRYTATFTDLKAIETQLEYLLLGGEGSLTDSQVDELYSRFQNVLSATNEWWQHERQEEKTLPPLGRVQP